MVKATKKITIDKILVAEKRKEKKKTRKSMT